jgi:cytochrome bd ubiquinol oxidase subunit I
VAAVIALESGWIVTEVGRQPWIVYQKLRVADAVTTSGGIWIGFALTVLLYVLLGVGTILLLRVLSKRWRAGEEDDDLPYAPRDTSSPTGSVS